MDHVESEDVLAALEPVFLTTSHLFLAERSFFGQHFLFAVFSKRGES